MLSIVSPPVPEWQVHTNPFAHQHHTPAYHLRTYTQEGKQIEKIVSMTNWDYYEAVERFQRILDATGINKTLKKRGAKEGARREKLLDGRMAWVGLCACVTDWCFLGMDWCVCKGRRRVAWCLVGRRRICFAHTLLFLLSIIHVLCRRPHHDRGPRL
jgi:Obg family GTPase CgtA-like protein